MSAAAVMEPAWLAGYANLLRRRIGFALPRRNLRALEQAVRQHATAHGYADPGDALALLESVPLAEGLLQSVVQSVTINESYFFRDPPAMAALRSRILPELIARCRNSRTLRVWSAGCAAGEELYSLAILLREALPNPTGWTLALVGTDIDADALAAARRASYSDWALRVTTDEERRRYFVRDGRRWRLRRRFRDLGVFGEDNLASPHAPLPAPGQFNLILCRNVTIYFTPETTEAVYTRLRRALAPDGVLITGASDLRPPAPFSGQAGAGVVVSRLSAQAPTAARGVPPVTPTPRAPIPAPAPPLTFAPRPTSATSLARPALVVPPLAPSPALPADDEEEISDVLGQVRQLADGGELDAALRLVAGALARHQLEPALYLWMAVLREANGELPGARACLERVLYLDPHCAEAHLRLGLVVLRHDRPGAVRHLRNAVIAAHRPDTKGHAGGSLGAAEVAALSTAHLSRLLKEMRS